MAAERGLGLVALGLWLAHALAHLVKGHHWSNLLWACNVAILGLAVGLLARAPALVAAALMWFCVGVPLWLVDLAAGGDYMPTTYLVHLGGLGLAAAGVRRLGCPPGTWWKALAALAALQLFCRVATPPVENVNIAFEQAPVWRELFPSYALNWLGAVVLNLGVFALLQRALRRLAGA